MNGIKRTIVTIGLALSCGAAWAQGEPTSAVISDTTFDNGQTPAWTFTYFYPGEADPLAVRQAQKAYYFPEDVELTDAVYQFSFDLTALDGMTGFGGGTGAPLYRADTNPELFSSGDRADYTVTFAAKAEGLAEGQTSASGEMQVQFYRRDESNQELLELQVNLPFQATANWQTFTYKLDAGTLGAGTVDVDFEQFHAQTTDLRFAVNLHEPFRGFGYDADNALYLNNIKVEVATATNPGVETPTYAAPIVDWNLDTKPMWYSYPYQYSQNANNPIPTAGNNANNATPNVFGKDGSSAWFLTMDNSGLPADLPAFAGVGTGGGGPVDLTKVDSGSLANYRLTFEARAEGLAPERLDTSAVAQLFFEKADGDDDDTNPDTVVMAEFTMARLGADWQTYSFDVSKGANAAGKDAFAADFAAVNGLKLQFQISNATSEADWGFDADNAIYMDNIKLERIYEGLAPIAFAQEGNDLVLNWADAANGTTTLQAADTVNGTYANVVTEGATYRAPIDGTQRYFRLVWNAPENP